MFSVNMQKIIASLDKICFNVFPVIAKHSQSLTHHSKEGIAFDLFHHISSILINILKRSHNKTNAKAIGNEHRNF